MASMYEIEKQIEAIVEQVKALAIAVGIEDTLNEEQPTIEELTDPDA